MNIKKMLLLASMAMAAVAFAAPAAAQANALLTDEGSALEVGAEVTATSTNLVTVSGVGTLECELVTIHGEVVENGPEVEIEDVATTTENCNSTITNPTAGTITLNSGTGVADNATFVAGGVCDFAGNIPFSYTSGTDVLTVTGANQLSSACGPGSMSGSFTLETADGTAVIID